MWPDLATCNANSADVMPTCSTHAANPNEIMHGVCNMCAQVSWVSLHNIDMPHYTY